MIGLVGRGSCADPKENVNPCAFNGDWQPGDLLLFSGRHCLAWGIRIGTCSRWSHVGGLAYVDQGHVWQAIDEGWLSVPQERQHQLIHDFRVGWHLFESTTLVDSPCRIVGAKIRGVQAHRPMTRVVRFNGDVWLLRLHNDYRLNANQVRKLTLGYLSEIGTAYDGRAAFKSGTRIIKRSWYFNRADMSSLFCSEMIARRLQVLHLLPLSNPARYSPRNLYRTLVGAGVYRPPVKIHSCLRRMAADPVLRPYSQEHST